MLAELSWPLRILVKAFVGNPWLYRMRAKCDLQVTINNQTQRITSDAIPSVIYY